MSDDPKVSNISPHLKNLRPPAGMGDIKAWLCWRAEKPNGADKILKMPYYANQDRRRGKHGTLEDRDKLVSFEAAKAAAVRYGFTGVGIAILPGSSVVALDFDDVVQDPKLFAQVKQYVANTYAEFSPSGQGVRAFYLQGDELEGQPIFYNLKSMSRNGHDFTFEVFASSGFVTFTGNALEGWRRGRGPARRRSPKR